MNLNYNAAKLERALQDFYNATGINLQLVKEDLSLFHPNNRVHNEFCKAVQESAKGHNSCRLSDLKLIEKCKKSRKAEMCICHAGLVDVCVPIIYNDTILAYLVLGQMKKDQDFSEVEKRLSTLPLSSNEIKKHYDTLPLFDYDKIDSILNVAVMLAEHILLANILKPSVNHIVESAVAFIDNNLDKHLSVEYISKSINLSKSALYKNFHDTFQCTLSEYINRKRIERSIKLLTETNLSIEEISLKSGFSSAAYFAVIFKKQKGISPLRYRKANIPE